MMKKFLLLLLLGSLITACKSVYTITVKPNGKAFIEQKIYCLYEGDVLALDSTLIEEAKAIGGPPEGTLSQSDESVKAFVKNPTIKKFKWTTSKEVYYDASYWITDIDSLGSYINVSNHYLDPVFSFSKESFTIICPPGTDENFDEATFGAIFVEMTINLPYEIKTVDYDKDLIELEWSKKQLLLKFKVKNLYYAKVPTILTATFNDHKQ